MKRAVLVGIDDYTHFARLHGCVKDVNDLAPLLATNEDGSGNFEIQTWTSDKESVDRTALLKAVDQAFAPGVQSALFFFAGHGDLARNDLALAAQDGRRGNVGIALGELMGAVHGSKVEEVLIILDCCYSGDAGNLSQFGANVAALKQGVSIMTASRDDQGAAELGQGLFTMYLCDALRGGATDVLGVVTLAGAYAYLSESFGAFEQRPTFKAHIDRLHPLRRCTPAVARQDLMKLPAIFETPLTELPLDPTFEPTAKVKKKSPENQATFKILQACRAARLVEPIGFDHMYDAAMASGTCRLTQFGRHYWRLAKKNKLWS